MHITEIALENYRSFRSARCRLFPFTLIVGANNAGKSNLLKAVRDVAACHSPADAVRVLSMARHYASEIGAATKITLDWSDGEKDTACNQPCEDGTLRTPNQLDSKSALELGELEIYRLDPHIIGAGEGGSGNPHIAPNGSGVSWLLDKWNAGARAMRARFERVVTSVRQCVPEIDAVSFYDEDVGKRAIQVEQTSLPEPRPLSEVSDGTRLVLAILTLVNQETPPPVLLIEDIDRGLHPRLYEKLVTFLQALAAEGQTQILATTHDPYLVDEFRDLPEAVVIVEKIDGASTLSNLNERLKTILEPGEEIDVPLGQVWFSGMVGGVPCMKLRDVPRPAKQ